MRERDISLCGLFRAVEMRHADIKRKRIKRRPVVHVCMHLFIDYWALVAENVLSPVIVPQNRREITKSISGVSIYDKKGWPAGDTPCGSGGQ